MKKISIYEPAMCCSTGICGVGVDTELLRISTVLDSLKKNGVIVDRFNLTNAPMEFVTNDLVNQFLREKGDEGLPLVLVDGEIAMENRYPTNEEFLKILEIPESYISEPASKNTTENTTDGGCCSEGSCCC